MLALLMCVPSCRHFICPINLDGRINCRIQTGWEEFTAGNHSKQNTIHRVKWQEGPLYLKQKEATMAAGPG